jgi:hypothetical protein
LKVCSRCGEEKLRADFPKIGGTLCKPCKNTQARETYNSNLEVNRVKKCIDAKRVYSTEKRREKARIWRKRNPEKVKADNKKRYKYQREWLKKNKALTTYHAALRRTLKSKATPPWVKNDPKHLTQIADLYKYAKLKQEFDCQYYHVDHIEPLKGKTSCGLHVVWNLRVLPALENIKKHNKLIVQPT